MKTERRHDLETNALAGYLTKFIERVRPYSTMLLVAAVVAMGLFVAFSYWQKSRAAQQNEAWNAYNRAIEQPRPDLEVIKQAAEKNAGDPMANWANITWADGQLFRATQLFIQFRGTADKSLQKAEDAYLNLLNSSDDPFVTNRANFGLGRLYEMRNEIDAALDHYNKVEGGFSELAKKRAEALEQAHTLEAIDWLAKAEPPPLPALGESTPSAGEQTLPFEVDEFDATDDDALLGDIIKRFGQSEDGDQSDRYDANSEATPDTDAKPTTDAEAPTGTEANSPSDTAAEAKAGETPPNQ